MRTRSFAERLLPQDVRDAITVECIAEGDPKQLLFADLLNIPFPPPQRPKFTFIDLFAGSIPVQDPALVKKRMELSKYRCEYNPSHQLFVARATGARYVEVHHVIPRKFQPQFWIEKHKDLTRLDNLCSLCPWCHRAIHHGEEVLSRKILATLFDLRGIGFHYGISKEQLFQLYSVEEIVRDDFA